MTLLQDLHCLARGSMGNGEDLAARHGDFFTSSTQHESQARKGSKEDPLTKLAHSVLFKVSPKHQVQAVERDGQDFELEPSAEEDSGYQTSDNENEDSVTNKRRDMIDTLDMKGETMEGNHPRHSCIIYGNRTEILDQYENDIENRRENFRETLNSVHERRHSHDRQSFSSNGAEILDFEDENDIENRRENFRETLNRVHERRQRVARESFSSNGAEILDFEYGNDIENRRENFLEALNMNREHERIQSHARESFSSKGVEILDFEYGNDSENSRENFRETLNGVHERIESHARQSFSNNGTEILDFEYENDIENRRENFRKTLSSVHERIQSHAKQSFSNNGAEILDFEYGNDIENRRENFRETLNSVHERRQRHARLSFSSNGAEILDLSYPSRGLKRKSETLGLGYEMIKRRRTEDSGSLRDEDNAEPQILESEHEKRQRRQSDNSVDYDGEDYEDCRHEEEENDELLKRKQTEDSIPEPARDFEGFGAEEDQEPKAELQTEEALANSHAVERLREEQRVEITHEEQEDHQIQRLRSETERLDSVTKNVEAFRSLRGEEDVDEEQEDNQIQRLRSESERLDPITKNAEGFKSLREEEQQEETVDEVQEGNQIQRLRSETERLDSITKNDEAFKSLRQEEQKEEAVDEVQEPETRPQTDSVQANPLTTTPLHSRLLCCTNGFFRSMGGPPSAFESNCGCTTRNLVDWRTRVTWTNSSLCHQVRIREVTVLSPFRTSAIPWGLPGLALRYYPPSKPLPQYQKPVSLPQKPKIQARAPQHVPRLKKEQMEEEKTGEENDDGERGYRCDEVGCGRTFCRNEELTRHLRIHSGQRPYACQRCGRRFVRRDHLTKHQRTHLPAHVKRSYTCPLPACTHRYTRSDALTRHMWTAHHVRARQPPRPTTNTTSSTTHHHHHHLNHHHQQQHRSLNPKLET